MKYRECEFRLGEPGDFLLGISSQSGELEDGSSYTEWSIGILFFSIAIIFNID